MSSSPGAAQCREAWSRWRGRCVFLALAWVFSATLSWAVEPPCPLDGNRNIRLQAGLELLLERLGLDEPARDGRLAVALAMLDDPDRPQLAYVNGGAMFYAASLPKIAVLLGAAVELERGSLTMDPELSQDLHNMIRVSCNACATRVLNRIGRERLLEILQDPEFRFYDPNGQGGLWVGKAFAAEPAYRRDPLAGLSHGANALQVVRFYCALEEGTLVNERQSAMMLETLVRPEIEHKFVKALAPYRVDEIFRKSGTWRQYHADSALVRLAGHSYVMVALAQDPKGSAWLERLGAGLHELATSWQRFDTLRTANARGNAGPTALTGPPSATALLLSANEKD